MIPESNGFRYFVQVHGKTGRLIILLRYAQQCSPQKAAVYSENECEACESKRMWDEMQKKDKMRRLRYENHLRANEKNQKALMRLHRAAVSWSRVGQGLSEDRRRRPPHSVRQHAKEIARSFALEAEPSRLVLFAPKRPCASFQTIMASSS